jgi:hypothetical protein
MNDFDRELISGFKDEKAQEKKEETLEEFRDRVEELAKEDANFQQGHFSQEEFSKKELDTTDQMYFKEFESSIWSDEFIAKVNARSDDYEKKLLPTQHLLAAYMRGKIQERISM